MKLIKVKIISCVILCQILLYNSELNSSQVKVKNLKKDECHFFAQFNPENTKFLALVSDGTYTLINREHMFTIVGDTGTWDQDKKGIVTLISNKHYRDVERGPLSIFLWYDGPNAYLNKVQKKILKFLKNNNETEFSADQIKKIYQYPSPVSPEVILEGIHIIDMDIEFGGEKVKREEFKALLDEIEVYKNSDDVNQFRFIPLEFKGRVFLEWKNHETPINRNQVEMIKCIKELKDEKTVPYYFFMDIDLELFKSEANTTQPFIVHKEMNKHRREGILNYIIKQITKQCSRSR